MEQQDRPERDALFVDDGNGVGIDGHGPLAAPDDRQSPQRLGAAADGGMYRAIRLRHRMSLFVGEPQQFGMPRLSLDAGAGNARQAFGPAVPQHDAARRH